MKHKSYIKKFFAAIGKFPLKEMEKIIITITEIIIAVVGAIVAIKSLKKLKEEVEKS